MNIHRAWRAGTVVVAALLALTACGGSEPGPTGTSAPTGPAATRSVTAVIYTQSDVDSALVRLDDLNLIDFHTFDFPPPTGGMPARSEDCSVRWIRGNEDQRADATFSATVHYAQNDNTGPFIIQTASVQPGTNAKDTIAKMRASYAGPCKTWSNPTAKYDYAAAEDTSLGSFGDETYGYRVTATSPAGTVVVVLGVMMRKGTLLSNLEYAGTPTVNEPRAKSIFAAAAKLLPQN